MRLKASIAAFVFVVCGALSAGATHESAPVQLSGPASSAGGSADQPGANPPSDDKNQGGADKGTVDADYKEVPK